MNYFTRRTSYNLYRKDLIVDLTAKKLKSRTGDVAPINTPPIPLASTVESSQTQESIPAASTLESLQAQELPNVPEFEELENSEPETVPVLGKRKRYQSSDHPMLVWLTYMGAYLLASYRGEGRGRHTSECARCRLASPPEWFRCLTCFGHANICKGCALKLHRSEPLHQVKVWKDGYWKAIDLRQLGVSIDLGHPPGVSCPRPRREVSNFVLTHTDGIHLVRLQFCGCHDGYEDIEQLLDAGWWPGSPQVPVSTVSEEALKLYDKVSSRGRVSTYHWCQALLDLSNPYNLLDVPDVYKTFKLVQRQYRVIKMMKRAGRGYLDDPLSYESGSLALQCRACPHEWSLPDGWQAYNSIDRWLYTRFISIDANFRAKAKMRSDDTKDPSTLRGQAYVANHDHYLTTIAPLPISQDTSHCSGFNAMSMANLKRSKGLRATGIGMVVCSRHEIVHPQAIGDLQVGERYRNMDYLFLSSLKRTAYARIGVSYDISCQWSIKLEARMAAFPEDMQLNLPFNEIDTYTPKFHAHGHNGKCNVKHSLNYRPNVGRTDGESAERRWSCFNQIASQAKELGPGGRHDLIDVFVDRSNWRMTIGTGSLLKARMDDAISNFVLHNNAHRAFTAGLLQVDKDTLLECENAVVAWEKDTTRPNPFELKVCTKTMTQLRAELAAEEDLTPVRATNPELHSPSSFLWELFALEKLSAKLKQDIGKKELSPTEKLNIRDRRQELSRRQAQLREIQYHHMPGLRAYLSSIPPEPKDIKAEDRKLWPPSAFSSKQRKTKAICDDSLSRVEARMRYTQGLEKLEELRRLLCSRAVAQRHKALNMTGQVANTRAFDILVTIERKITLAGSLYRHAYEAYLALIGSGDWQKTLRVLDDDDIVGLNERVLRKQAQAELEITRRRAELLTGSSNTPTCPLDVLSLGEGHRMTSWIWHVVPTDESDKDTSGQIGAGIKVEWAKSRARSHRWREEVQLLEEEMRRTILYSECQAKWWTERLQVIDNVIKSSHYVDRALVDGLKEGLRAYAAEHTALEVGFRNKLKGMWQAVRERAKDVLAEQSRLEELDRLNGFQELNVSATSEADTAPGNTTDECGCDDGSQDRDDDDNNNSEYDGLDSEYDGPDNTDYDDNDGDDFDSDSDDAMES